MGKSYRETLIQQLKDPLFKAEWETLEPEYQLIRLMIEGREKNHLSQKELADLTGITQADISRIENGNANPSLQTLKRLASGMGMRIRLEFLPMKEG